MHLITGSILPLLPTLDRAGGKLQVFRVEPKDETPSQIGAQSEAVESASQHLLTSTDYTTNSLVWSRCAATAIAVEEHTGKPAARLHHGRLRGGACAVRDLAGTYIACATTGPSP